MELNWTDCSTAVALWYVVEASVIKQDEVADIIFLEHQSVQGI